MKLYKNYSYDNTYNYTKSFTSKEEQQNYFNLIDSIFYDVEGDYLREYTPINIELSHSYLVENNINYLSFNNGYKDIYAFIIEKNYINDDVTEIVFEVDVIQTFMFNVEIGNTFIERKVCSIDEITDFDEGIDFGEHILESSTNVYDKGNGRYFAMFSGFKDYFVKDGNVTELPNLATNSSSPLTFIDNIPYPLSFFPLDDQMTSDMTLFLSNINCHPSLVGIVRFPSHTTITTSNTTIPFLHVVNGALSKDNMGAKVATTINTTSITSSVITVSKSKITDFFPYTYYVLSDGETNPLTMQPQYLPTSFTVKGVFANSHSPSERFYPSSYKGDTTGNIYNITNANAMMLPTGKNTGLEQTQASFYSLQAEKKSSITNSLLGVGLAVGGAIGGNPLAIASGVATATSGVMNIINTMSRYKDLELTPSSISSFGTPSSRDKFNTKYVKVLKYTITENQKSKVNAFVNRFGNKFNNYGYFNITDYKGFIKLAQPNILGGIDNSFKNRIISTLERGVYFE